jgi:hypothetical protein
MNDSEGFKRLNFFTGFFTTADDWNEGQEYHHQKRRLHNRRLHTPGIMAGEKEEFRVEAAGGLNVKVKSGAALDADGDEVYLRVPDVDPLVLEVASEPPAQNTTYYIVVKYREAESDRIENVDEPQYSGYSRVSEWAELGVTDSEPNNTTTLELARVELAAGMNTITDAVDPQNPKPGEIDRRFVKWAGAVLPGTPLSLETLESLVLLMQDKRSTFAALDTRFPVPSASDVRHAALTVEMVARTEYLRAEHVPSLFAVIAAVEEQVAQEIADKYPGLVAIPQYQAYQTAVNGLLTALQQGQGLDDLINRQHEVAIRARELSEITLQPPDAVIANKGQLAAVPSSNGTAIVQLDASLSQAHEGREIDSYHWNKKN